MANMSGTAIVISGTQLICPAPCSLIGIFCAASTAGSLTLYDAGSSATTNTLVPAFAVTAATYYPLPFNLKNGLYAVASGTVSATVAID